MRLPNVASRRAAAATMSSSSGRASRSRTKCDTSGSPETLPPPESLDELYRSAPEDFVASRNRLVRELKAAGDAASARALAARRKPTRAAHALERARREHQADVEAYLGLASEIRTAQVSAARRRRQGEDAHPRPRAARPARGARGAHRRRSGRRAARAHDRARRRRRRHRDPNRHAREDPRRCNRVRRVRRRTRVRHRNTSGSLRARTADRSRAAQGRPTRKARRRARRGRERARRGRAGRARAARDELRAAERHSSEVERRVEKLRAKRAGLGDA